MFRTNMMLLIVLAGFSLMACGKSDPDAIRAKQGLPPMGFVGDAIQGASLFTNYCSGCHGQGALGSSKGPPLVNKIYEPGHHPDFAFYQAAKAGVRRHHWQFGDMPAVSDIKPEQVAHVVAYIRKEQRKAGIY